MAVWKKGAYHRLEESTEQHLLQHGRDEHRDNNDQYPQRQLRILYDQIEFLMSLHFVFLAPDKLREEHCHDHCGHDQGPDGQQIHKSSAKISCHCSRVQAEPPEPSGKMGPCQNKHQYDCSYRAYAEDAVVQKGPLPGPQVRHQLLHDQQHYRNGPEPDKQRNKGQIKGHTVSAGRRIG